MTDTATPQLEWVELPWSRMEGLPPLPPGNHPVSPDTLAPAVPVTLINPEAGPTLTVRPQLDTGLDETVFGMDVAEQLGLAPGDLEPAGQVDFPLRDIVRDVLAVRLPAVIAGKWEVTMDVRFVAGRRDVFFGSGLLGRDVIDGFRVIWDGPGKTIRLEREGER